jgi:hypothetical protein
MDSFTLFCLKRQKDPRRPGGTYWNGYWRLAYTVGDIVASDYGTLEFMCLWHDGTVTYHCTAWEPRYDRVVYTPPEED